MDNTKKKQELVNEFNELETRQREIMGALKLLEEIEKEKVEEDKPKEKK